MEPKAHFRKEYVTCTYCGVYNGFHLFIERMTCFEYIIFYSRWVSLPMKGGWASLWISWCKCSITFFEMWLLSWRPLTGCWHKAYLWLLDLAFRFFHELKRFILVLVHSLGYFERVERECFVFLCFSQFSKSSFKTSNLRLFSDFGLLLGVICKELIVLYFHDFRKSAGSICCVHGEQ